MNRTLTFESLCRMTRADLSLILEQSPAPEATSLVGYEWRGYNRARSMTVLGIRKFIKGFFISGALVEGYNVPTRQTPRGDSWHARTSGGEPRHFGYFVCRPVEKDTIDARYPEALILDYGASARNRRFDPTRALIDYVVQPDASNPDLLLGRAFIALGPLRIQATTFVLERMHTCERSES